VGRVGDGVLAGYGPDFVEDIKGCINENGNWQGCPRGEDEGFGVDENETANDAEKTSTGTDRGRPAFREGKEQVSTNPGKKVDDDRSPSADSVFEGGAEGKKAKGVVGEVLPVEVEDQTRKELKSATAFRWISPGLPRPRRVVLEAEEGEMKDAQDGAKRGPVDDSHGAEVSRR